MKTVARMSEAISGSERDAGPGYRGACHRARFRATRWLIRATMLEGPTSLRAERSNPCRNKESMDCFVALLLAMTAETERANGRSSNSIGNLHRPMPVRQGLLRDRHAGALGLARSFGGEPARAWRGLCDLCRKLAQALPHHQGQRRDHPLRGQGDQNRAQLLRAMRHAAVLRTRALAAHGEHPARAVRRAVPAGSRSITSPSRRCRSGPIPASRWCR